MMLKTGQIEGQFVANFAQAANLSLTTVPTLGPQLTLVSSKASRYRASMVKTRKNQPVVTALAASHPAVVPVISALSEETVPEKAPAAESCAPSTSDEVDVSRPVRVYADGKAAEQGFNASSRSGRRANTSANPGIFDLFHFGHAKALEQAKRL